MAALRSEAVREGLLARFGGPARRAFFAAAARDPDSFGYVCVDQDGVAGFVLLTTSTSRIERTALLHSPRLWLRGIAVGVRSPTILRRGLRRLRTIMTPSHPIKAGGEPRLRLLDIVVASRAQGRGYGRALLAASIKEAWRRDHDAIGLSVLVANVGARRLYESAGFTTGLEGVRDDGQPYITMRLVRPTAAGRPGDPSSPAVEGGAKGQR